MYQPEVFIPRCKVTNIFLKTKVFGVISCFSYILGRRFGDFEMDTIVGKDGHGAIVTLTERSTNMLFMRKLNKVKNAKELARTIIHLLAPFKGCVKSITTDK